MCLPRKDAPDREHPAFLRCSRLSGVSGSARSGKTPMEPRHLPQPGAENSQGRASATSPKCCYRAKDGMLNGSWSQRVMPINCGVGSPLVVKSNCSFSPDWGFVLNRSSDLLFATG